MPGSYPLASRPLAGEPVINIIKTITTTAASFNMTGISTSVQRNRSIAVTKCDLSATSQTIEVKKNKIVPIIQSEMNFAGQSVPIKYIFYIPVTTPSLQFMAKPMSVFNFIPTIGSYNRISISVGIHF